MKNEGDDYGWGVVVNFSKKSNVKVKYTFSPLPKYIPDSFFSESKIKHLFIYSSQRQKNFLLPQIYKKLWTSWSESVKK